MNRSASPNAVEDDLHRSDEGLKALRGRLELVLDGVADAITVQDRSGRLVFANTAAARLCGLESADEFVNTPPESVLARFDLLDGDGHPFKLENLPARRVLAGSPSASAVLQVYERATGKQSWAAVRASAILGADGLAELAVNIWHDVTNEHRVERDARYTAAAAVALASSNETNQLLAAFAKTLLPALADWCSVYLLEGATLRNVVSIHVDPSKAPLADEYQRRYPPDSTKPGVWNVVRSRRGELYNDISDELLARTTSDPDQLTILRSVGMTAVLVAPITVRSEVRGVISIISAESGRRYDRSQLDLLESLGERVGVAIERAELYRAAQFAAKAAEEASRAKDEFMATVSHELRTPLNAVLGWATILKEQVSDPVLAKAVHAIHRNAQAQARIIDDILDVSRVMAGKLVLEAHPTDLVRIVRDAADVVRPSALAKSLSLELNFEDPTCPFEADAERLQQVVWNLLSNAVKFTPAGGNVRLSLRRTKAEVVIAVTDSGDGIAPDFLPFVFDRFRQADPAAARRTAGLGLGLALVRQIVELHGGRVTATSDGRGKGSTFTITLPVRSAAAPPLSGHDHPASAAGEAV